MDSKTKHEATTTATFLGSYLRLFLCSKIRFYCFYPVFDSNELEFSSNEQYIQ